MSTPASRHHATSSSLPIGEHHSYIGRFAPSPSGPLHFGSLVSALASYAHARQAGGLWHLRMENLDPPREEPGADDAILRALEQHGLTWDGPVLYQSDRLEAYAEVLERLHAERLVYPCTCTRKDIRAMGGVYDGRCRERQPDTAQPHAWRLKVYDAASVNSRGATVNLEDEVRFNDLIQGPQRQNVRREAGDPIIKRKDGLFAYQLAVIVDDIHQQITHVIRGGDLLELTAGQINAFRILGGEAPAFGHVPVALNAEGQKLSKQHHAPALDPARAGSNLWQALVFLRQSPPPELRLAPVREILDWALEHWDTGAVNGPDREAPAAEYRKAPAADYRDKDRAASVEKSQPVDQQEQRSTS